MSPMIYSLPSFMRGHVSENLACTRVMAGPENIRAGFVKESDVFKDNGIQYVAPFVNMAEPEMVPKQMYDCLKDALDIDMAETQRAVDAGYKALYDFNEKARAETRKILTWCARNSKPCVLVLARPYHMDPGIGHEIESDLQAHGYPIV
jgi:predicted nucleotide-binding protein (sugar kinase/HSP70/actin superfamily)